MKVKHGVGLNRNEMSMIRWVCGFASSESTVHCCAIYTGWPNKNCTFLRYHIFAATTYIIMQFLLKCSEITAENDKRNFFKRVLNILCKVTGN